MQRHFIYNWSQNSVATQQEQKMTIQEFIKYLLDTWKNSFRNHVILWSIMASHVSLLFTSGQYAVITCQHGLLPLPNRRGVCEDVEFPLSWSSSGQFTCSFTTLRPWLNSVRFVWEVLFHLLFPPPWIPVPGKPARWRPNQITHPAPWWCRVCWWQSK